MGTLLKPTNGSFSLTDAHTLTSGTMPFGALVVLSASMSGGTTGASGSSGASSANGTASVTVGLTLSGLRPSGTYIVSIARNACGNKGAGAASVQGSASTTTGGQSLPPLPLIRANSDGDAMLITNERGTSGSHTATLAGLQASVIDKSGGNRQVACGTLHTPTLVVTLKAMSSTSSGSSNASGNSSGSLSSGPTGIAMITTNTPVLDGAVSRGTEVIVFATGLQPKVAQPNHIHLGTCGTSGPVLFPLLTLLPDSQGRAIEGTGIPLTLTLQDLSLHIHRSNFLMEACGNLTGTMSTSAS